MLGDFNIHLDEENNPDTITFNGFLESFGLINYMAFFTHTAKHILDLVISNELTMVWSVLPRHHLSDHSFVHVILEMERPIPPCRLVRYRKYKNLDKNKFRQDLIDGFMDKSPCTMDEMVHQYNNVIITALDKQVPVKTKLVRDTHHQPWFNEEIKTEIILWHKKEREWIQEQSEYSWRAFYNQHRYVSNMIKTAQQNYFKVMIEETKKDYKAIFNIANSLLFGKQDSPLPEICPLSVLAEDFSEFFEGKIDKIMLGLEAKCRSITTDQYHHFIEDEFKISSRIPYFTPVFNDDIKEVIRTVPQKHYKLDPLPINIMKEHMDVLAYYIAKIVNISFDTGYFSDKLKEAIFHPFIKNTKLEAIFTKFRPVSNLSWHHQPPNASARRNSCHLQTQHSPARTLGRDNLKRLWPMLRPSSIGWKRLIHQSRANHTFWWGVFKNWGGWWNHMWPLLMLPSWRVQHLGRGSKKDDPGHPSWWRPQQLLFLRS